MDQFYSSSVSSSSCNSSFTNSHAHRYSNPPKAYDWVLYRRSRYLFARRRFARLEGSLLTLHSDNNDDTIPVKTYDMLEHDLDFNEATRRIELRDSHTGKKVCSLQLIVKLQLGEDQVEKKWHEWNDALKAATKLKVEEWYTLGKRIGVGHYGAVYEGWDRNRGDKVAIKLVDKVGNKGLGKKERLTYVKREKEIVGLVGRHENVIKTLDVFDEKRRLVIVMEFAEEGNVLQWLKGRTCTEGKTKLIAMQVISAVASLHGVSIIHRDVKPENLLIKGGVVKLCDFGLSRLMNNYLCATAKDFDLNSVCGTPVYVAPEIARKENYSFPIDMWSCGVLLYVLISGRLPFSGNTVDDVLRNIARSRGKVDFATKKWKDITEDCKQFIRMLLQPNPQDRLTANEALEHPWLASCKAVYSKLQQPVAVHRKLSRVASGSLDGVVRSMSSNRGGSAALLRPMSSASRRAMNASPVSLRHQWSSHNMSSHSQSFRSGHFSGIAQPHSASLRRQESTYSALLPTTPGSLNSSRQNSNVGSYHQQIPGAGSSNFVHPQLSNVTIDEDSFRSNFGRVPSAKDARVVRSVSNRDKFSLKFWRTSFDRIRPTNSHHQF